VTVRDVLYFGCWHRPGHYLFCPNGGRAPRNATPFGADAEQLDRDCYKPGKRSNRFASECVETADQIQGAARLTHERGWTIFAFWDRSVDHRGGCHSTFVAPDTWTAEEMIDAARAAFPQIWARYSFEVRTEVGT
jgi:hypothetical protein